MALATSEALAGCVMKRPSSHGSLPVDHPRFASMAGRRERDSDATTKRIAPVSTLIESASPRRILPRSQADANGG